MNTSQHAGFAVRGCLNLSGAQHGRNGWGRSARAASLRLARGPVLLRINQKPCQWTANCDRIVQTGYCWGNRITVDDLPHVAACSVRVCLAKIGGTAV